MVIIPAELAAGAAGDALNPLEETP